MKAITVPHGTPAALREEGVLSGIAQVLEYYDLTPAQIRVYLYLAKNGPTHASKVAKRIKMHRTETHKTINQLESLGLMARTMERPMRYTALSFHTAIRMLWEERKKNLDAIQATGDALIKAFEAVSPDDPGEETRSHVFTRFHSGLYMRKIEELNRVSATRLYYLEEGALGHLSQHAKDAVVNERHPNIGSFAVFDGSVFLLKKDHDGVWGVTEIHVPEIVAAYTELYRYLEVEQ